MSTAVLSPPTNAAPATKQAPVPQNTARRVHTERTTRILLVEDEPLTAEVFARALSRDGHVVEVARDGLQALRRFHDRMPSLIVLDMSLPALSGSEILQRLRSEGHLNLPIVVVSGSPRSATAIDEAALQPGTWLEKPVKPRDLVRIVRELVGSAP